MDPKDIEALKKVRQGEGGSRTGAVYLPRKQAARLIAAGLLEAAPDAASFIGETAVRLTPEGRKHTVP